MPGAGWRTSVTAVPYSVWRDEHAICSSENFDSSSAGLLPLRGVLTANMPLEFLTYDLPTFSGGTSGRAPAVDSPTVRSQVVAAMRRSHRFMRMGPPDSVAPMFTQDGKLYKPRGAVHLRRTAIRSCFTPLAFTGVRIKSANTTTQALHLLGSTVLQWGDCGESAGEVGRPSVSYRGRFVAEWVRQAAGCVIDDDSTTHKPVTDRHSPTC